MPTIRGPSWRPRTIHGYRVESYKTQSNLELECETQFQYADLTPEARAFLLRLALTAWFLRLPGDRATFATLIWVDGHDEENLRLLRGLPPGGMPLTAGEDADPWRYRIRSSCWHYSVVDRRAETYLNGNPVHCWTGVRGYLNWMRIPEEDRRALEGLDDL